MVNYLYGVRYEDKYRFKLITEPPTESRRTQSQSQTDQVIGYLLDSPPAIGGKDWILKRDGWVKLDRLLLLNHGSQKYLFAQFILGFTILQLDCIQLVTMKPFRIKLLFAVQIGEFGV